MPASFVQLNEAKTPPPEPRTRKPVRWKERSTLHSNLSVLIPSTNNVRCISPSGSAALWHTRLAGHRDRVIAILSPYCCDMTAIRLTTHARCSCEIVSSRATAAISHIFAYYRPLSTVSPFLLFQTKSATYYGTTTDRVDRDSERKIRRG